MFGPHPPQRSTRPSGAREKATEPVPAISSTPAESPKASSIAMVASACTDTSSATRRDASADQSACAARS